MTQELKGVNGKKHNKGMSLIELVVAMVIIAILSTGAISIYKSLNNANTKKIAVSINDSMSRARIYTMSKSDRQYLYLYKIDGKLYSILSANDGLSIVTGGLNSTDGMYLSDKVNLSYKTPSGTLNNLNDNEWIYISFLKSSGAFDTYYPEIVIKSRNQTSIISCIKETGRHWVD